MGIFFHEKKKRGGISQFFRRTFLPFGTDFHRLIYTHSLDSHPICTDGTLFRLRRRFRGSKSAINKTDHSVRRTTHRSEKNGDCTRLTHNSLWLLACLLLNEKCKLVCGVFCVRRSSCDGIAHGVETVSVLVTARRMRFSEKSRRWRFWVTVVVKSEIYSRDGSVTEALQSVAGGRKNATGL